MLRERKADYSEMAESTVSRANLGLQGKALGFDRNLLLADQNHRATVHEIAEAFEAILGAVYVDSGHHVPAVKDVLKRVKLDNHKFLQNANEEWKKGQEQRDLIASRFLEERYLKSESLTVGQVRRHVNRRAGDKTVRHPHLVRATTSSQPRHRNKPTAAKEVVSHPPTEDPSTDAASIKPLKKSTAANGKANPSAGVERLPDRGGKPLKEARFVPPQDAKPRHGRDIIDRAESWTRPADIAAMSELGREGDDVHEQGTESIRDQSSSRSDNSSGQRNNNVPIDTDKLTELDRAQAMSPATKVVLRAIRRHSKTSDLSKIYKARLLDAQNPTRAMGKKAQKLAEERHAHAVRLKTKHREAINVPEMKAMTSNDNGTVLYQTPGLVVQEAAAPVTVKRLDSTAPPQGPLSIKQFEKEIETPLKVACTTARESRSRPLDTAPNAEQASYTQQYALSRADLLDTLMQHEEIVISTSASTPELKLDKWDTSRSDLEPAPELESFETDTDKLLADLSMDESVQDIPSIVASDASNLARRKHSVITLGNGGESVHHPSGIIHPTAPADARPLSSSLPPGKRNRHERRGMEGPLADQSMHEHSEHSQEDPSILDSTTASPMQREFSVESASPDHVTSVTSNNVALPDDGQPTPHLSNTAKRRLNLTARIEREMMRRLSIKGSMGELEHDHPLFSGTSITNLMQRESSVEGEPSGHPTSTANDNTALPNLSPPNRPLTASKRSRMKLLAKIEEEVLERLSVKLSTSEPEQDPPPTITPTTANPVQQQGHSDLPTPNSEQPDAESPDPPTSIADNTAAAPSKAVSKKKSPKSKLKPRSHARPAKSKSAVGRRDFMIRSVLSRTSSKMQKQALQLPWRQNNGIRYVRDPRGR